MSSGSRNDAAGAGTAATTTAAASGPYDLDAQRGAARTAGAVGNGQTQRVEGIAVSGTGAGRPGVAAPCSDGGAVPGPLVGVGRRAAGNGGRPGRGDATRARVDIGGTVDRDSRAHRVILDVGVDRRRGLGGARAVRHGRIG